ncbi:TRAP transporter small permease [Alkalicoccus halolimnae]|uniref:TRAP transporter small permease n=1 Tax=Alkalicoccus halolimnae TaxID=1667239 RepID=A0A5C7F4C8_9BACI|nr:TRAP transporter small permease [Alkalicoccus halolimnae]TXF85482.1 TRAP transporter small permease [Alkalicoccus halolimnae]
MINVISRIKTTINQSIMIVASVLTVLLVISALWQVISRFIGMPSTFTEELLRFMLIWVAFLGATYAFGSREQLAIIFLKNKLRGRPAFSLQLLIDIIVIVFVFAVLVVGGLDISSITMNQVSPILGIPMGYIYYILPISGILIIFYQVINIFENIIGLKDPDRTDLDEGGQH